MTRNQEKKYMVVHVYDGTKWHSLGPQGGIFQSKLCFLEKTHIFQIHLISLKILR